MSSEFLMLQGILWPPIYLQTDVLLVCSGQWSLCPHLEGKEKVDTLKKNSQLSKDFFLACGGGTQTDHQMTLSLLRNLPTLSRKDRCRAGKWSEGEGGQYVVPFWPDREAWKMSDKSYVCPEASRSKELQMCICDPPSRALSAQLVVTSY